MAKVDISITRQNGVFVQASAQVDDELIVDIAATLGAILFDHSAAPADSGEPATSSDPTVAGQA